MSSHRHHKRRDYKRRLVIDLKDRYGGYSSCRCGNYFRNYRKCFGGYYNYCGGYYGFSKGDTNNFFPISCFSKGCTKSCY